MITIKNKRQIELIRQGGKSLGQIFKQIIIEIKPDVTTGHLEQMANFLIEQAGGRASFKGYQSRHDLEPFPTALCTSINDEVVHAPSLPSRVLKDGDIVGIDLGMEYPYLGDKQGYYTDVAATVAVGKVSKKTEALINAAKQSLAIAVNQIKSGNTLNQIGKSVEDYIEIRGFKVVRELVGHGVGLAVHEEPQIPNYDLAENKKIILKAGMVLAIEPMVNLGDWRIKVGTDGFTILTKDGRLSAHFEHTILVTDTGYEILTKFDD